MRAQVPACELVATAVERAACFGKRQAGRQHDANCRDEPQLLGALRPRMDGVKRLGVRGRVLEVGCGVEVDLRVGECTLSLWPSWADARQFGPAPQAYLLVMPLATAPKLLTKFEASFKLATATLAFEPAHLSSRHTCPCAACSTKNFTTANGHSEGIKTPSRLRMRGGCVASTSRRTGGQLGNRRRRPGEGRAGGIGGRTREDGGCRVHQKLRAHSKLQVASEECI